METYGDIIKNGWPGASDQIADYILWSRTDFPFGAMTAKKLYKAANRTFRAHNNKITLCEFCDTKVTDGSYLCNKCQNAMDNCK